MIPFDYGSRRGCVTLRLRLHVWFTHTPRYYTFAFLHVTVAALVWLVFTFASWLRVFVDFGWLICCYVTHTVVCCYTFTHAVWIGSFTVCCPLLHVCGSHVVTDSLRTWLLRYSWLRWILLPYITLRCLFSSLLVTILPRWFYAFASPLHTTVLVCGLFTHVGYRCVRTLILLLRSLLRLRSTHYTFQCDCYYHR